MRIVKLLIVTTLLLMGTGVIDAATYTEEASFSFDAVAGLRLEVHGTNGSIEFRPWNGSHIRISATKRVTAWSTGRARNVADRITIERHVTENAVRLEAKTVPGQWFVTQSVAFEVLVPMEWFGTVVLDTNNGAIRAERIDGDVTLETSNGSITVNGHAGRLYARTSNGRIELRDLDSNVYARTSNGRVILGNAILRGSGELRTSNGSVQFLATLKEDANYEVRTSNGSITLDLIEPVNASLDLRTSNGSVHLIDAVVQTTSVGRGELAGSIGTGSASLTARTSNGSIRLSVQ